MKQILLLILSLLTIVVKAQEKSTKDTSLVPSTLATCSQTLLGCNFNNWPNPLKGESITYPAPVNGNCYDGSAATKWNCITTRANQTWFYVRILTRGNIRFVFNNSSNVDVDGVLWGPVANNDLANACSVTETTPLVCDYNADARVELPCTTHSSLCGGSLSGTIPVEVGQIYVLCILNYANRPTNITLSQPLNGSVYYSQESLDFQIEHFRINNGNKADRVSLRQASAEDNGVFKVCADGSTSSLFKVTTTKSNVKARISQDPTKANTAMYGEFTEATFNNGVYEFTYKHPDYLNSFSTYLQLNVELYEQSTSTRALASYPLRIHPAPLLMVHGLWSNGTPIDDSSFEVLEGELGISTAYSINTNEIVTKLYRQADYRISNDASFSTNDWVVPVYIASFKDYILKEGYSFSKVDIIGHSMGGILSRLYLQSSRYNNDIHKLITLNTPHSGSQVANFLSDPLNTGDALCEFVRDMLSGNPQAATCQSGAINDLKVNSDAIRALNSGAGRIKVVPSHAIATTFPTSQILRGLSRVPKVGMMAMLLNIGISIIFNGEDNDGIVALSSQKGGVITTAQSTPSMITPHSSQSNNSVRNQIKTLLTTPTSSSIFTTAGFNPPTLVYSTPPPENRNQLATNATMQIIKPANAVRVNIGGSLGFEITSTNIVEINAIINYDEDEVMSYSATGNIANFTLPIDNGFSIGPHSVLVIGKTATGETIRQRISFEVTNCVSQYNTLNGNLTNSFYQADNLIITNGKIPFGQNIQMSAGQYIEFIPGFDTDPYTILNTKIGGCSN
jgi:pimeloyl-ACP methyl ester carboxylesterase